MTDIPVNDVPAMPETDDSTSIFELSDSAYKKLKALVTIILPAVGTLVVGLGATWGLDATTSSRIAGTILAITTFLGVLLKISSVKFRKNESNFDGVIDVVSHPDGDLLNVHLDPAALTGKDLIQIKVNQPPS